MDEPKRAKRDQRRAASVHNAAIINRLSTERAREIRDRQVAQAQERLAHMWTALNIGAEHDQIHGLTSTVGGVKLASPGEAELPGAATPARVDGEEGGLPALDAGLDEAVSAPLGHPTLPSFTPEAAAQVKNPPHLLAVVQAYHYPDTTLPGRLIPGTETRMREDTVVVTDASGTIVSVSVRRGIPISDILRRKKEGK